MEIRGVRITEVPVLGSQIIERLSTYFTNLEQKSKMLETVAVLFLYSFKKLLV